MADIHSFEDAKRNQESKQIFKADDTLVPLYVDLIHAQQALKDLEAKITKLERELLPPREAAQRQMMRHASKLNW